MPSEKKVRTIRSIINSVTESKGIKKYAGTGRPYEWITERESFQHYGYTSRPQKGAEAILLLEDNKIYALAEDDRRYRIAVENGEVCIYTDEGDKVHFKRNKTIHIVSGNKLIADVKNEVTINTKDKTENIFHDRKSNVDNDDTTIVKKKSTLEAKNSVEDVKNVIEKKAGEAILNDAPLITINGESSVIVNSPVTSITSGVINLIGHIELDGDMHIKGSGTIKNDEDDVLHHH